MSATDKGRDERPEKWTGSVATGGRNVQYNNIYHAPIDYLGPPGRWVRHKLLEGILEGVPLLKKIQQYRTPFLDVTMHTLSFLGTEEFYTPVFVSLIWIIDIRLGRLFGILMALAFYLTTFLKNAIRLPRPPSPPVAVLEVTFDWALPSLHSLIGSSLPWYIYLYSVTHFDLPGSSAERIFFFTITFWSLSVGFSRLYLGVHSLADIIVGYSLGFCLVAVYFHYSDYLDFLLTNTNNVSLYAFLIFVFLLTIHPSSGASPTKSYGESTIVSGVAFGVIVAMERTIHSERSWFYTSLLEHKSIDQVPGWHLSLILAARIIVGFPIVLLIRLICKKLLKKPLFFICHQLGLPAYSFQDYCKTCWQLNKHYTTGFQIPSVWTDEPKLGNLRHPENGNLIGQPDANSLNEDSDHVHRASNGHSQNGTDIQKELPMNGDRKPVNGEASRLEGEVKHVNGNSPSNGTVKPSNGINVCHGPESRASIDNVALNRNKEFAADTKNYWLTTPLDMDIPVKFLTYTTMTWFGMEAMHHIYDFLGITAHHYS